MDPAQPAQRRFLPDLLAGRRAEHLLHRHQRPERRAGQGDRQIHLDRRGRGEAGPSRPSRSRPANSPATSAGKLVIPTSAGPSVYSWSGGATLERTTPDVIGGPNGAYSLTAGSVTYHVSGIEGLISACHWSGTAVIGSPHPSGGGGSAGVFGAPPEFMAPYEYSIQVTTPPPPAAEITFTRSNCPEGADELEEHRRNDPLPGRVRHGTSRYPKMGSTTRAQGRKRRRGDAQETWVFEAQP